MAAPPKSFDDMFGGQYYGVDYVTRPDPCDNPLFLPELDDSMDDVAKKLKALADVVTEGLSVAVFTGFQKAAHPTMDAEAFAVMGMTPAEKLQYYAWKAGAMMPSINWNTSVLPVPQGSGSVKRLRLRAEAMMIIWGQEGLGPEHASWIVTNMTYLIPLIVAVAKVEGAKRDLLGGQSEMDMAEVQTIHKAVAIASDRVNEEYLALRLLSKSINASSKILQAREHALKAGKRGD